MTSKIGATSEWVSASSSPFFNYIAADGSSHMVWHEDEKSIPLKTARAVKYKLVGVSVFALEYDDPEFWRAVYAGFLKLQFFSRYLFFGAFFFGRGF